jgi:PAS domain S-box-containing protein
VDIERKDTASTLASVSNLRANPAAGYGVALATVAASMVVLAAIGFRAPVATFLVAVIVAACIGGTRAGAAAAALALVSLALLDSSVPGFVGPPLHLRITYFAAIAAFIVWIVGREREKSESLRLARDTLQRHIDTFPMMGWICLPDGRLEFLNRRWLDYTGMPLERALIEANGSVHPDDAPRATEAWRRALESRLGYEQEMRLRRADGQYRWFLVRIVPFFAADGSVPRWYGTSTDIDDLRRAQHDLHRLSRRLLEIQEEERRHLSRELHDEFGQLLAAIGAHVEAARLTGGERARANLEQALDLVQQAGDRARKLVVDLRPAMIEAAGIDATLRWLARQHMETSGTTAEVSADAGEVPDDVAIACFRIAQQALTNISQHARARRTWIELTSDDTGYHLVIRDDGAGFPVDETLHTAPRAGHLGLVGMRERTELLGGELDIASAPGRGTRIAARFPKTR